jgi:lipoprotein-anchoring transpeptidase ErfK/SrfK
MAYSGWGAEATRLESCFARGWVEAMQKHFFGQALLLAGVPAIVLGTATPAGANTAPYVWGAVKSTDIGKPERATKPKKAKRSKSTASRTVRIESTTEPLKPPAPVAIKPENVKPVTAEPTLAKPATVSTTETIRITELPRGSEPSRARETTGVSSNIFREEWRPTVSAKPRKSKKAGTDKIAAAAPAVPTGTLHVIVSIDQQRATLYANGTAVASTKVSTGTKSHPTPMGVFTIIQKNRHHVSNLYGAPMPYMQRLTWSGTALHTGPLPGYPASHGCIRLTDDFAQLLWKATKLGARVIVTRDDVQPAAFTHAKLIAPKPFVTALPAQAVPVKPDAAPVRTADAVVVPVQLSSDEAPAVTPAETEIDPRVRSNEAIASAQEIERRNSPVSIFVSRKDGKLYVRQAMQPLFDLPIALRDPEQPIGTHVYTAMELKDGAMRWTSVTIPSAFPREISSVDRSSKRARTLGRTETTGSAVQLPPSDATNALDRFDIPQEALDRLATLLVPGSSLIVSDNGIGGETGRYTDFIVLTR